MRHVATAADRIDYWIRRHIVACATPSNAPAADLHVGLTAIGRSLRDQYDALAAPVPPSLAALIKQLEAQSLPPRWPPRSGAAGPAKSNGQGRRL